MMNKNIFVWIESTYATYTILSFYIGSSVEEELQGQEMASLGGNIQSGTANLKGTISKARQNTMQTLIMTCTIQTLTKLLIQQQQFIHIH